MITYTNLPFTMHIFRVHTENNHKLVCGMQRRLRLFAYCVKFFFQTVINLVPRVRVIHYDDNGSSYTEIETVTRLQAGLIIENVLQYTEEPETCLPAWIIIHNLFSSVGEKITFDYVTETHESKYAHISLDTSLRADVFNFSDIEKTMHWLLCAGCSRHFQTYVQIAS